MITTVVAQSADGQVGAFIRRKTIFHRELESQRKAVIAEESSQVTHDVLSVNDFEKNNEKEVLGGDDTMRFGPTEHPGDSSQRQPLLFAADQTISHVRDLSVTQPLLSPSLDVS